jgi:uncharacterized protein HemX
MKATLILTDTFRKRRPLSRTAAAAVAALAAVVAIAIAIAVATSGASTKQRQHPAQTRDRTAATCAPDDTRPIGPGGEGVPACLHTP